MNATDLLPGLSSSKITTARLGTHLLSSGTPGGELVVFIHGNVSSGRFYEEFMAAMPPRYRCIAPASGRGPLAAH